MIKSSTIVEWDDDNVSKEILTLDGSDMKSTVINNSPRIQNANWSLEKDTLVIDSNTTSNFGGRTREIKSHDIWTLQRRGKKLVIMQTADSFNGKVTSKMVYDKQ